MVASYENQLGDWINKEKSGINLLNSVGTLMYDKGIELVLFRHQLLEIGVSELMNFFAYANNVVKRKGISAFKFDPFPIIQFGSGYRTKTKQKPGQVDHESNFFTSSYPKVTCPSSFSSSAGLSRIS